MQTSQSNMPQSVVSQKIKALLLHPAQSYRYRQLKSLFLTNYLRACPLPTLDKSKDVIVSLTSYGDRLLDVDLAIRSILKQSELPGLIILWIGAESNNVSLPKRLLDLEKNGLIIRQGLPNIKGHKKYFFACQEFPDATIITIDDDSMYPKDTIQSLMETHRRHTDSIVARRINRIQFDSDNKIKKYSDWLFGYQDMNGEPSKSNVAIGVGGVLYPPCCLPDITFDERAIKRCALDADDLWLKAMEIKKGIGVVWAKCDETHPYYIPKSQKQSLFSSNMVFGSGNDEALLKVMNIYDIDPSDFLDSTVRE